MISMSRHSAPLCPVLRRLKIYHCQVLINTRRMHIKIVTIPPSELNDVISILLELCFPDTSLPTRSSPLISQGQIVATFILQIWYKKETTLRTETVFICTIWHASSTHFMLHFTHPPLSKINLRMIL